MASPAELRDLLAENSRTMVADAAATQGAIHAMTGAVRALATNGGAVPGAAPPVLTPRSALQTVRKSSETIVQLSLSDEQYTAFEKCMVKQSQKWFVINVVPCRRSFATVVASDLMIRAMVKSIIP